MKTTANVDLAHVWVHDVMHPGIIEADPDTPLSDIAELMAGHRIHAVRLMSPEGEAVGKVISALDVVSAIAG